MAAESKPQLGWSELSGLAMVAKQIDEMPDSPEKEAMKGRYHDAFDKVLEHYDMPIQESSGRQKALGFAAHSADFGSGLLRTGVGETGLAAKAGIDKLRGQPSAWSGVDAGTRVARALNPFDRPALGMGQYLEMGGAPEMGRIADIEGNYPITGRGALGFAGDMALNPALLMGGLKSLLSKGAASAMERPPITADIMREAEGNARAAAKVESSPGMWPTVKAIPGQVAGAVMDPLSQLRDALLKYRFKNADQAVSLAENGGKIVGRPAPSAIFQREGAKGITSEGIRQDMRAIVNQNSGRINDITNEIPDIADFGITRGTPQMAENPQLLDPKSAMYPLYSPEQQAAERMPFHAREAQAARKEIESEYRAAAEGDPGLKRQLQEQIDAQGTTNVQNGQILNDRQDFLPGMKPAQPTTRNIPGLMKGPDGEWVQTERPITLNGGEEPSVAPKINPDPLSVDEFLGLPKVSQMAGAAQQKAATRKFYLSRDRFSPDSPQTPPVSREALAAEGGLYAGQGQHLRGLQEDLLDEARPGLGGDVHRINQESSSLLEGGPYIDRPKPTPSTGKPTSRSRLAFGGAPMMAMDALGTGSKTAAMAGYQALSNPWIRRGALPAARAMMVDDYWANQLKPTYDSNGMPGGDNPWALVYKYGGQQ